MDNMSTKSTSKSLGENVALSSEQQKDFNKKVKALKKQGEVQPNRRGVIYVGHIPHGFFEKEMKRYFTQFGRVTRLRLSRSKKTGNVKGYGFVEFEFDSVARVVADTMNNYMMGLRVLKCEYLPMEKVHAETFKGANRTFSKPKAHLISRNRHNAEKTVEQENNALKKMRKKNQKTKAKLSDMGISYDFPTLPEARVTSLEAEATQILLEDSGEEEISFTTPPNTVRSRNASMIDQSQLGNSFLGDIDVDDLETAVKTKRLGTSATSTPTTGKKIKKELLEKKAVKNKSKGKAKSAVKAGTSVKLSGGSGKAKAMPKQTVTPVKQKRQSMSGKASKSAKK